MRRLFPALALAVALAAPAAAQTQRAPATVRGVVVDSATGTLVINATVGLLNRREQARADTAGRFALALPRGTHVVTVSAPGYQPIGQVVDGGGDVDLGTIALPPLTFALEPVSVTVSALERRMAGAHVEARAYTRGWLESSGEVNLFDFVTHREQLRPTGCNTLEPRSGGECVRVRGMPRAPRVFIDDAPAPGGFWALKLHRPEDVARVEVYQGGAMVQVYTRRYVELLEREHRAPPPLPPF